MAQDMIANRVELAQPHEYSWLAAPYHANILVRKSIRHKKMDITTRHQDCEHQYFSIVFFLFHEPGRISIFSSEIFLSEKNVFRSLFF